MKYLPTSPRSDNPDAVMQHAGLYSGKKALIVLGGYSAAKWFDISKKIKPDLIICANGANSLVCDADYWLCCENLGRANRLAQKWDADSIAVMEMFNRTGAKNRMVSWHSWSLLKDTTNCFSIRRCEYDDLDAFSFRDYGLGYLQGGLSKYKEQWQKNVDVNVGTVGLQCLHHAGILGCAKVHTVGFDLLFRDKERHHAYEYPLYEVDRFRSPKMFTSYKGYETQVTWIESAEYLKSIEPILRRDKIQWTDHSDGLLSLMRLDCAK